MGGKGSGTWYRWDTQTTIEQIRRIDIRLLKARGSLVKHPNQVSVGNLSWSRGGEPSGYINFRCYFDRLELSYRYREGDGNWVPTDQTIHLEHTPCHFGGDRAWFTCPRCQRRVGILCGAGVLFLCRHCYRLPYRSQMEGKIDRLITRKHELGEKIFEHYENGEGYGKKKGMHWKTYNRLAAKYHHLELRWCKALERQLW